MKLNPWTDGVSDGVWLGNPSVPAGLATDQFVISWVNNSHHIAFHCRGHDLNRPRICQIRINLGEPIEQTATTVRMHGWDGNKIEPTITPSIGCDNRCGWHGHITKGELIPERWQS